MQLSVRHVFLLGSIFALGLTAGCGKKNAASRPAVAAVRQPVEVINIAHRDLVESLSLVGSLAANESAQLRAEISGQVRAVQFQEGDRVTKDQVLVKIDDAELRAQLDRARFRAQAGAIVAG